MKLLNRINLASIAKVCDTDVYTIEQIYKEILAQLVWHIRNGSPVRLTFKVGRLATRNGEINWKSLKESDAGAGAGAPAADAFSSRNSVAVSNWSTPFSMHRKNLSVVTPSVIKSRMPSLTSSNRDNNFHLSNPNPQPWTDETPKYKGPRDLGYKNWEKQFDPTDLIKFGKRVNYETKTTSQDVMEQHLKQMQDKMQYNK